MIARFPSQKKRRPNRPVTRWPGLCLLLAALATARVAHAQEYNETILEPQALRLQVTGAYGGVLAEGDYSTDSVIGQNGATGTYEQIFLGPVFGLDAAGSIYHPNLLSFTLDGEISPGYAIEKTRSSTYNSDSGTGFTILGNYDARFTFLGEKPYRATLYITQSYTDQDLDEFTQTQVDTFTYGGTLGYQSGPVPFTLGAAEQWQNTYGGPYQITSRQESLSFDARNTRVSGESTLDYLYNEYDVTQLETTGGATTQSVGLSDTEDFGSEKQIHLFSNVGYGIVNGLGNDGNDLNASSHLSIEHTPSLSSSYDLNFDRETSNTTDGTETSNSISGDAALTHQLYQSLTSTLQIQGLDYTTTDNVPQSLGASGNSTSQDEQIAGGIIEQYSKVITPKVHLSLGGSALYGYTNQRDTGGSVIQTNESHSFGSVTDSFFLNLPNVDESSIVVTDSAHTLPGYQDGIDYTVSQNGSLTLIRRTSTSTIPLNSKIYFTYTAAAAASGGYETFTGAANFRLDFYSGLLAVYARLNTVENFGAPQTSGVNDANPADFLLSGAEDLSDYTAGIDSSWHWVRLAAEYDVYDSNFGSSRTLRLDQNFTFRPDRNSGLDFDFSEGRSTYQGSSADESDYSAICSYRRSFSGNFGFDIKAGIELQRGDQSVDETLISVQPSLNYSIGDLTIKASYSFEYLKSDSSNQTEEQMLTISMQRTF